MSPVRSRPRGCGRASESAQSSVWMIAVITITVLVMTAMVRWAAATLVAAQLDATADLVALAGVVGGETEARSVAARNSAALAQFERHGERVEVLVVSGGLSARASAAPRDASP